MALVREQLTKIAQLIRPCPTATLAFAYLRAARDFCGQTRWYQTPVELTLTAGIRAYTLTPPVASGFASTQLEAVDLAWEGNWINSALNGVANWTPLRKMGLAFNPNLDNNTPLRVAYTPEGEVQFDPIPDQAYPVKLMVAWQPTVDATDIPDALLTKWRDAIEAGALAYLYALAGEPWANPNEVVRYTGLARAGINNGKAAVAQAFQSGSRRANPRPFFPPAGWPFYNR